MRKYSEWLTVFLIGGTAYSMLEILWRGYTHWSMTLTGGACFLMLYWLHTRVPFSLPLRCVLGCAAVTAAEFLVGCVVNLWLGLAVWDYSAVPLNLLGQICPAYSSVWLILSLLAAPLCRSLRHRLTAPA